MKRPHWWSWDEWGWALYAVFFALVLVGSMVFYFAAPCSWMGPMPAKDVPARCVSWVHR